ncbi:regulatory protein RecX [Bifidobacterium tsurumiense]|uniref:Regulatory protein RecX n=1 Tax=Bifidobacterium tsurumiense TaxID=356829 RepID=A0A087EI91_9BIFI|nr:regulatory protein RecX [Bifidobacterium tsurumiense]KFJ07492.1 RecX-like protein [Bifidobacterium tsurumiense]
MIQAEEFLQHNKPRIEITRDDDADSHNASIARVDPSHGSEDPEPGIEGHSTGIPEGFDTDAMHRDESGVHSLSFGSFGSVDHEGETRRKQWNERASTSRWGGKRGTGFGKRKQHQRNFSSRYSQYDAETAYSNRQQGVGHKDIGHQDIGQQGIGQQGIEGGLSANHNAHRVPDQEEVLDQCREAALRLLDAADRPSGALRERLLAKGFATDTVEDVIERLTRVGLINDEAYANRAVQYCIARMLGARATAAELRRKGVESRMARAAVDQAESAGLFDEAAWELGRRIAARTRGLDLAVRRRRFWGAGGRKGHNPAVLRTIEESLFLNQEED